MGNANEVLEHMEHAAHAGHGHGHGEPEKFGARVGITMALLGVVLALLGAQLSEARTELVNAVTNQNIALTQFQGNAARYRALHTQLTGLLSTTPSDAELKAVTEGVAAVEPSLTDPNARALHKAIDLTAKLAVRASTPDAGAVRRLMRLTQKLRKETDIALKWAQGYPLLLQDHSFAAEHYEHAQLASEIAIILASIALLRRSRGLWIGSVALGVVAMGIGGWTHTLSRERVRKHEAPIEAAREEFFHLKGNARDVEDDDATLAALKARFPAVPGDPLEYAPAHE